MSNITGYPPFASKWVSPNWYYRRVAYEPCPCQTSGMAAHEDTSETRVERKPAGRSAEQWRALAVGILASVIRWVGVLFAVVLVIYVILTVGDANPNNGITQFIHSWADTVSLGFKNLFTPDDAKLRVLVNYGIAALFWLVVTSIVAKLIRRLG